MESLVVVGMQKNNNNSPDAFIVSRKKVDNFRGTADIRFRRRQQDNCDIVFGDPREAAGDDYICAIEAIPTSKVFPLADGESCLNSCENYDPKKGGVSRHQGLYPNDGQDEIIGEIERAPGESYLCAAAFTDDARDQKSTGRSTLTYSPTDFTPYSRRR